MLIVAKDEYGDENDVTRWPEEDGNEKETEGNIAALYGEAQFHTSGQIEDDGIEKDDTYVDFGDDPPHEVNE